jgi:DNA-binding XRE family transcriptional regulator
MLLVKSVVKKSFLQSKVLTTELKVLFSELTSLQKPMEVYVRHSQPTEKFWGGASPDKKNRDNKEKQLPNRNTGALDEVNSENKEVVIFRRPKSYKVYPGASLEEVATTIQVEMQSRSSVSWEISDASAAVKAAQFVKLTRKEAGLSQEQLGEILGISQSRLSRIENAQGRCGASVDLVSRIAQACGGELFLVFSHDNTLKV